ncbi:uncharacterized protein K452DRAFT_322602 [Aplosporella prunicola CBS 121167]|uniref:Uncharacterized protein n=1 Tax=Aplosporella prunicola CBS 121167 TaxID=1176127 RepID=A0A6A6AWS3_9PEZI|nr:uncharacterized protein K452DRAFT_322602 [Aplosporella prunicola CBS 121167]KAF2136180.1 hypothetical protein K452DRAFT_322602 [Aplosporella prunicola CBS 121167]
MNIHLVLLSSYLGNWEYYLETLAAELQTIQGCVLVFDIGQSTSEQFTSEELQDLLRLQNKVLFRSTATLRSTVRVVKLLEDINGKLVGGTPEFLERTERTQRSLRSYLDELEGHLSASEALAKRIQATIGLLVSLLDLRNQAMADKTNSHMLQLTREGVDDNATVRVITVFTLIYLPATFIAVFESSPLCGDALAET